MHTSRRLRWLLGAGLLWATACGDDESDDSKGDAAADAATHDAAVRDASSGGGDSGVRADGGVDAGGMDGGGMDAAAPDSGGGGGAPEAGTMDAQVDTSTPVTPASDAGDAAAEVVSDAAGLDAESADAGTDAAEGDAASDATAGDAAEDRPYLQSGFEVPPPGDGDEGWEITGGANPDGAEPVYAAMGGNQDGFISFQDDAVANTNPWYFSAPSWFLGDVSYLIDTTLTFELKATAAIAMPFSSLVSDVVLVGDNNVTLVYGLMEDPTTAWTPYTVPLSQAGWKVGTLDGLDASAEQLLSVLSNLKALQIRGEFDQAAGDGTGLDNVVFGPHQ